MSSVNLTDRQVVTSPNHAKRTPPIILNPLIILISSPLFYLFFSLPIVKLFYLFKNYYEMRFILNNIILPLFYSKMKRKLRLHYYLGLSTLTQKLRVTTRIIIITIQLLYIFLVFSLIFVNIINVLILSLLRSMDY